MPFKMTANRTVYRSEEAREYQKGQSFTVQTERERDRLLKTQRAKVEDAKNTALKTMRAPEPEVRPAMLTRAIMSPDPSPAATDSGSTDSRPRSSRYRRNDMRAED